MAYYQYPYSPTYFGNPYQQMPMQQPQQAVQTPSVQPQYTPNYAPSVGASSLIWVKGRMDADAYPVAPNGAVAVETHDATAWDDMPVMTAILAAVIC